MQQFHRQLKRCRHRQNPDLVHDLRVESRRLRVWCDLLVSVKAGPSVPAARREVKRLWRSLARLRDTQVQLELLQQMPKSAGRGVIFCRRWLRREETFQSARVLRRCRQLHPMRISAGIIEGVESIGKLPRERADDQWLERQVRRWVGRLVRAAEQAHRRVNAQRPITLHRLRISLKQLRYALEALGESTSPRGRTWSVSWLRNLQGLLGEIQDAEVFLARLKEAAIEHPRHAAELPRLEQWLRRRRDSRIRRILRQTEELSRTLAEVRGRWALPVFSD